MLRTSVGAAAAVGMVVAMLGAGSAQATGTGTCVPLPGNTPAVGVDLDGDGVDDARLPAVSDVTLCVGADVVLEGLPTIEREQCGGLGSCMRYWIEYDITGYAHTGVTLCYAADGVGTCTVADPGPVPLDLLKPRRMCVGWDLRGGSPCPGPDGPPINP